MMEESLHRLITHSVYVHALIYATGEVDLKLKPVHKVSPDFQIK